MCDLKDWAGEDPLLMMWSKLVIVREKEDFDCKFCAFSSMCDMGESYFCMMDYPMFVQKIKSYVDCCDELK